MDKRWKSRQELSSLFRTWDRLHGQKAPKVVMFHGGGVARPRGQESGSNGRTTEEKRLSSTTATRRMTRRKRMRIQQARVENYNKVELT